jgi:hypothetical protein
MQIFTKKYLYAILVQDFYEVLVEISQRKKAYVRDGPTILFASLENSHLNLAIGKEKYFSALIALPINKRFSETREKLYEM